MKVKELALAILMIAAPLLLPAAGQREGQASEKREFRIRFNPNHVYDVYVDTWNQFAEQHNLELVVDKLMWGDFRTKIKAEFAAGNAPDLIEVPANWIPEFAAIEQLHDLTAEITSWPGYRDFFDSTWVETTLDGRLYGMKLHHTCFALFYNRQYFRRAGLDPDNPPQTLSEFFTAIKAINRALGPEIKGFAFDPSDQYLITFLASRETPYLIKDGKIHFKPSVRETIKFLGTIARSGEVNIPDPGGEEEGQAQRLQFLDGKTAMMISGPWDVGNIMKNFPDLDYSVAMVPHIQGVQPMTYTAGTGLAIPRNSQMKGLAFELMKRLTDVEVEVQASLERGMLMPRKTWIEDPRLQEVDSVRLFSRILPQATPYDIEARKRGLPEITWSGNVFKLLYETLLYLDEDLDAAIDRYITEANKILAR